MNLTVKTDYCLRVLIYLQMNPGKTKIQQIANAYQISKNHLSVAANKLSELGYVISSPGPRGGIEFNPKMKNKTVGALVSSLEEFNIVECFAPKTNTCTLSPVCKLKKMLQSATESFIDKLKDYQISDLA
ncbi:MAG: Rrf2 family transcriptional regulator [Candidatus Omnitrophica bacterium]|nr:Rrf2 family transcriptional regulator [Candidatus Omnitrophota bacterium]